MNAIVNAMTVDVEDYFQVSAFATRVPYEHWPTFESRVCRNTERLLGIFEHAGVRATFFVLGWVAERFPKLVRRIHDDGHELASHSYAHGLVYDATPEAFRDDLRRAKAAIENATSVAVRGYRAPSYSIVDRSLWALDVLIGEGYQYDSSIYPIHHDRYGIPAWPRHIHRIEREAGGIWELPGSTVRHAGTNFPIGGGGYFRLLPYGWTSRGIRTLNQVEKRPAIFYLHPWEVDPDQPRIQVGLLSRMRHYYNLGQTERRLKRLLSEFRFGTVTEYSIRIKSLEANNPSMQTGVPQLHDYLIESARRLPDKVALVCQDQRLTYRELDQRSNALAHALESRGVKRGDRVVVFADNTVASVVSFFGVLKANAVVSMVNPQTKDDKLAYLLNDCRASAIISDAHLAPTLVPAVEKARHLRAAIVSGDIDLAKLSGVAATAHWDGALAAAPFDQPPVRRGIDIDLASIIYTSGSTGDPKGVMLTHRNMMTAATSVSTYLENVEDDIIMGLLPLSFDYGLFQLIMAFRMGARLILERSFTYPAEVLNRVVAEKVTGFPGVPTIFAILGGLRNIDQYDFSQIRYVTNTAAALSIKNIEMIRSTFPAAKVFSMYGLTECKRCTYLPPADIGRKPLSVGIAIPNTELWIVNDNDERVGPGEVGQLVIRGATVMRGYWEKPEETAKKLRPGPLPGEMVLYTGDFCKLDDEGYLYFVGRMDDIIKSRGEKVAPKEVESAIVDLPGVREAAVIGVPDPILGQAVKALVVLDEGSTVTERDIQSQCARRLENFMVPKFIEIVAELPKTTTGKIKKTGLS